MDTTASSLMEAHARSHGPMRTIPIVKLFRGLYVEEHGRFGSQDLFKDELQNELPLNKRAIARERTLDGNFEEHFLFMYIENSELPWDDDEMSMDW